MRRKIETMRVLQCPNGMGNTHYVAELAGVKAVDRMDDNHLFVAYSGDYTLTTIGFGDFKEECETKPEGATGVCVVDLRETDAIAVRYEGREKWNRHYLPQITGKGGRFSTDKNNHLTNK